MFKLVVLGLTIAVCHAKTWIFEIDEVHGVDVDDHGEMTGFMPDLVKSVCFLAGKHCATSVEPRQDCGNTVHDSWAPYHTNWRAGTGLMSGWVDVCTWRADTPDRRNSVDFSKPFQATPKGRFAVQEGNPLGFDPTDIHGKTIGIISGVHVDQFCVEHMNQLKGATYKIYANREPAIDAVKAGEVDATLTFIDLDKNVQLFDSNIDCGSHGIGMMSKKGSGFVHWWNAAFDHLVDIGCFKYICDKYQGEGGIIDCFDFPTSGSCDAATRHAIFGD